MKHDDPLKKVEKSIYRLAMLLEDDADIQEKIIELSSRAISEVREEIGNKVWHIQKDKGYSDFILESWDNCYEQQFLNEVLTKKEIAQIIADELMDEYGEMVYTANTICRKLSDRELSRLRDKSNKNLDFIDDSSVEDDGVIRVDWDKVC